MKRSTSRSHNQQPLPFIEGLDLAATQTAMNKLGITERELQVLCWIASGKSNQEIATILGVSFFTVKTHVKNIFRRLDVNTRTAAAAALFRATSQQSE